MPLRDVDEVYTAQASKRSTLPSMFLPGPPDCQAETSFRFLGELLPFGELSGCGYEFLLGLDIEHAAQSDPLRREGEGLFIYELLSHVLWW